MNKKIFLFTLLFANSATMICANDSLLYHFIRLIQTYAEHQKMMNNRPSTKIEWETIVDKKIEHFLKYVEPTADNDDDRSYWLPQMRDIATTIHYRYKDNDPLASSLSIEQNTPLIVAAVIGFAGLVSIIHWYATNFGGAAAPDAQPPAPAAQDAPPPYPGSGYHLNP